MTILVHSKFHAAFIVLKADAQPATRVNLPFSTLLWALVLSQQAWPGEHHQSHQRL
jgi:hypothetical protein